MRIVARAGLVWIKMGDVLAEMTPEMAEEVAGDFIRFAAYARAQLPAASLEGLIARVGTHPGAA